MSKRNGQILKTPEFKKLLGQVRGLIISARRLAGRSVDTIQVLTNFRIGQVIVEHEQQGQERAEYGKKILEKLSNHLTSEFGTGFSLTNLKLMRQFYFLNKIQIGQTVSGQLIAGEKGQTVSDLLVKPEKRHCMVVSPFKLSWSHYVFLMGIADGDILVEVTLPKEANIYASEYKLYLPSKTELKRKLLEWSNEEKNETQHRPPRI